MSILLTSDPVIEKLQKHFKNYGMNTSTLDQKLDFEDEFISSNLLANENGIGNLGTIKVNDSPIDYINVLKKQELAKCDFAVGGYAGMGVHIHSWLKLRFFLSFSDNINIGPLNMGTLTTIKKGLLKSEIEEYDWSGYKKLTTLPPGLVLDNVAEFLDKDQVLGHLMNYALLKEKVIMISRYNAPNSKKLKTNAKIVIESSWKFQKDVFLDNDSIRMYELMAEIIKKVVNNLKYHLK